MKKALLTISVILSLLSLFGISISHIPPATLKPGLQTNLRLEVIQGWDTISEARLVYRIVGENPWMRQDVEPETPEGPWMTVYMPALRNAPLGLEYYFEFTLLDGNIETLPQIDPTSKAFTLGAVEKLGKLSDAFIKLNDESSINADEGFRLAISYFEIADDIDLSSIKIYVNERDVTKNAAIGANVLLYTNDKPVPGTASAIVTAKLKDGSSLYSDTWITTINPGKGRSAIPMNLRGAWNFSSNMYSYSSDDEAAVYGKSRDDASSSLDAYGSYKSVNFQTNLFVSSLEKTNKQPVNRYTFGVTMPYWETYLGDYSPTMGEYTMSNKNLRGLYTKLSTPYVSLAWAHGEMVRKTSSGPASDSTAAPTFKQEAIGARLQFGSDRGFYFAFNATRNRDLISSLDQEEFSYLRLNDNGTVTDTVFTVTPQDNLVLGVETRLTIPEQNVVMGFEAAGSMFNRNTFPGSMTTAEIEDYLEQDLPVNIDGLGDLFVINKNIEPLVPDVHSVAWKAFFRTYFSFFWDNLFNISYSEVGSAFNSLSTNYQQQDTKNLSITHQINFNRFLFVNGGFTRSQDNLSGFRSETNTYDSYYVNSILRLNKLPYLRASYFVNNAANESNLADDDAQIFAPYQRDSKSFNVGMGYNLVQLAYVPTQIDVSYRGGTDEGTVNSVLSYDNLNSGMNVTLINRWRDIPLKTQVSFATNNQELKLDSSNNSNFNVFLQADYMMWQNKLKPFVNYRTISLGGDQESQSYTFYSLGFDVYPISSMSINSSLAIKNYQNNDTSGKDYSSTTWRFMITQRF